MTDDYEDSERPGEDSGRRSRRPRSTGSNRTLWLILGGTGCLIVLVCGGIGALAVWGVSAFTKDFPAVEGVANEFFDAVKAGNLEVAFNKTSAGYRAKNTPEQFASFIKQHETLSKHTTRTMNGFNIYGSPPILWKVTELAYHWRFRARMPGPLRDWPWQAQPLSASGRNSSTCRDSSFSTTRTMLSTIGIASP